MTDYTSFIYYTIKLSLRILLLLLWKSVIIPIISFCSCSILSQTHW